MFAYCGNNPVINIDSTGYMYVGLINGNPETIPDFGGGGGYCTAPSVDVPIRPDDKETVVENLERDAESVIVYFSDHRDDIAYALAGTQYGIDALKHVAHITTPSPFRKYVYIASAVLFIWESIDRIFD